MVKASRRVKRIKRSKKQVHRAHGRKTNRRRYTRRQRGGMGFFQSLVKRVSTEKLNPKNGPLYDGIEVFKVDLQDGARYYIGNQPLNQYLRSSIPTEIAYGKKIQKTLNGIDQMVDQGDTFKDQLFLDQVNFDKFQAKFPAAAGAAASVAAAAPVAAPAPAAAAASSAAEFDKRCVITSNQVSFLGTPIPWQDHNLPLEITTFEFAQKNERLMEFLQANVAKFVFFKTELTVRVKTAKTEKMYIETYDAIFLSIHFKKTRENDCALATFKGKDAFNLVQRIYDSTLKYPHFLLYPNNQPGTNDTTDQENVATCYIGKYADLPKGITYDDFVKVIDQFATYKTECKDLSGQMSSISVNP